MSRRNYTPCRCDRCASERTNAAAHGECIKPPAPSPRARHVSSAPFATRYFCSGAVAASGTIARVKVRVLEFIARHRYLFDARERATPRINGMSQSDSNRKLYLEIECNEMFRCTARGTSYSYSRTILPLCLPPITHFPFLSRASLSTPLGVKRHALYRAYYLASRQTLYN